MIDDDDPILEKAIGTKIDWCPGKCLTQKILKKKPKKGSKNAKPIIKTETCESFFNFFKPPQVPEDDDDDGIDEDAAEELQNLMEQNFDIGSTIRDKIIPHDVSWFTGEAAEGDELEDIEDAADDDEDEHDVDEEDEDDEEEEKNKKKKRSKAQVGEGQQGERPPECKQQ